MPGVLKKGRRFGKLVVKSDTAYANQHERVACGCDCGHETLPKICNLVSKHTESCGCERDTNRHGFHLGRFASKVDRYLCQKINRILQRCYDPKDPTYKHYGGRGIEVFREWRDDPRLFIEYLKTLPGHDNFDLSLDRKNNNGHYAPGNLRFATQKEQCNNQRWCGVKPRGYVDANDVVVPLP